MPCTQKKLSRIVPYSERTIRDELGFLEYSGYVERIQFFGL